MFNSVEENHEYAYNHAPQLFIPVFPLYIDCEINGRRALPCIDSGAVPNAITVSAAKEYGLDTLIDTRVTGTVHGVGTTKIIGQIHVLRIKIKGVKIWAPFVVIAECIEGIIFGNDILRRFKCIIDLKNDNLNFQSLGFTVKFLSDADVRQFKNANPPNRIDFTILPNSSQIENDLRHCMMHMSPENDMPYIGVGINQRDDALCLVDTGAYTSSMNIQLAERYELDKCIDTSRAGTINGVGHGKITGIIYAAFCEIGKFVFPATFNVDDSKRPYVILGLNALRGLDCTINFKENTLNFKEYKVNFS